MPFEIKNPNYSRESLEEIVAAIISRNDSAEPIRPILDESEIEKQQSSGN